MRARLPAPGGAAASSSESWSDAAPESCGQPGCRQNRFTSQRRAVQAVVDSDGVCGVIACGHQIVATASHPQLPPSQHLHSWDLLLLLNLVTANSSYRGQLAGQQAWVPLCLAKSSPDCFHFLYVHYPSTSSPLFIALVGRSQQMFFEMHSVREPLMATLESTGALEVRDP